MSRARMRAGGSVSAVAALALSAMGLAALPASADEEPTPAPTEVVTADPAENQTTAPAEPTESPEPSPSTDADDANTGEDASGDDAVAGDPESTETTDEDADAAKATGSSKSLASRNAKVGPQADDDPITLDIVAISDFHGHIENAPQLDNMVKAIEAGNPDYTGFVGNGDLVGGSAYVSAIAEDEPTIAILSKMGLEMSSAGNHEFDKGYRDFEDRITGLSKYPYAAANVQGMDEDTAIAPYVIKAYGSGDSEVKVAYVGAVTDQLGTLVAPDGIAGLTIEKPVPAINEQAAVLKESGDADVVVALIHETLGTSKQVGPDVDAVVAGHTHQIAESTTESGAPAIETGQFGTSFGHITVTVDGKDVSAEAEVTKVPEMYCEGDPAWDAEDPEDQPSEDQLVENAEICEAYLDALEEAEELGKEPVGEIIGGADQGTNNGSDLGANRGTEMTGGNLIAQAFYEYSQGMTIKADFGIMNPGGVRASIDGNGNGTVTKGESFTAQPFGNDFATVDITGAQVYTMLEQQWADESTQTSRPMLALGLSDSISFTYDADADFGSHIKQVFINNELVDPDSSDLYTVASNQFLLAGGDGFNVFKEGENYNSTGLIDNEVFNDFLAKASPHEVDYAQRNIAITGEDELYPGTTATIDLKSLSMTYEGKGQPLPETVDVSLVETLDAPIQARDIPEAVASGSSAVDNTVTPDLNETGQAVVDLEVPDDLDEGDYALVIEAGTTVFQIPGVTVEEEPAPEPTEEPTTDPSDGGSSQPSDGSTTQPGEDLPNTGANVAGFVVVALLLVTAGGVLVARRKTDQV
ncbi:5'-nucleotidase C-terminal domain-containing protein [Ancrocorticia populi]|uniref:5'-nucleotidase C-terminal domain-containing protein n=1 Tax=Ancrocorticia populi TaxID=2175228 RepID=UPI003F9658B4